MKKGLLLIGILLSACSSPIQDALDSDHEAIKKVIDSIGRHEIQILFTQIDSNETGALQFTEHRYQVNSKNYFYPASTVKMPMAVLAAEYISKNDTLNLDVAYISARDTLIHSVADDIRQIFAVSDNEAYNRLYELLGRDYVNSRLNEIGISKTRIAHRLSTTDAANPQRLMLKFFPSYEGDVILKGGAVDQPIKKLNLKGLQKGKGFLKDGNLIHQPMNFSQKNFFPISEQHELLKRIIFPESFPEKERFTLNSSIRERLLRSMHTLPKNTGYAEDHYYDGYVKFFMYGDTKERIPDAIKIYNKVGYAYGTLTDTAYILDKKNGIHFLLSATILVNENGIFNDDTYEYDTVGIPFLAQLGRELYKQELVRKL